jgi:hypothetical protein
LNTAQKIIINLGGISFVFVIFLSLILDLFSIFFSLFLLILIVVLTAVSYKVTSSSASPIASKAKKMLTSIPLYKKTVTRLDSNTQKINKLVSMTENKLFQLSTVFPFKLFRDDIIIEQKQIIIVKRNFFYTSQQHPIAIKDILAPVVEAGFLFAKLKLELGPGGFQQNPPSVSYLKKAEARRARRIIMGLILCDKEDIDLTGMSREDILKKVEEIGRFKLD